MQYPLCRHIRTCGRQCQAPALTGQAHCFFHNRLYQRHSGFRHTEQTRGYLLPGQHIQLAPLEDRDAVQVALSVVINALATGQLEVKRATALLYGLQLASTNAVNIRRDCLPDQSVLIAEQTPDGIDLAQPGATLVIPEPRNDDDYDDEEEDDEEDEEEYEDEQDEDA